MIENFFFPAEKALTPELIEPLSYPYLVDALRSGVTSCVDAYFFMDGMGRAFERLGMRGFIGEHIADLGGPHDAGKDTWKKVRHWIENWQFSSLVQPVVYAHASDTVSFSLLKEMGDFARTYALPFHMHLSQTWGERQRTMLREKKSPVRYALDAGVIGERSLLVHLVSADGESVSCV
jgi:5-methylthioadenosine/S-adenosylhomocysteine deaminase